MLLEVAMAKHESRRLRPAILQVGGVSRLCSKQSGVSGGSVDGGVADDAGEAVARGAGAGGGKSGAG